MTASRGEKEQDQGEAPKYFPLLKMREGNGGIKRISFMAMLQNLYLRYRSFSKYIKCYIHKIIYINEIVQTNDDH